GSGEREPHAFLVPNDLFSTSTSSGGSFLPARFFCGRRPTMLPPFDLQGHRGARGLRPENTLPSFEAALDAGVTTIETDLHRTRDGVLVLCHDPFVTERLHDLVEVDVAPPPSARPAVSALTVRQLRAYRASRNPDSVRFPDQKAEATALARLFAERQDTDPYGVPTPADLFAFEPSCRG